MALGAAGDSCGREKLLYQYRNLRSTKKPTAAFQGAPRGGEMKRGALLGIPDSETHCLAIGLMPLPLTPLRAKSYVCCGIARGHSVLFQHRPQRVLELFDQLQMLLMHIVHLPAIVRLDVELWAARCVAFGNLDRQ